MFRYMTIFRRRSGFTLMEVNLAIFIMAVAVLGMVALYPLGFRENQHSRDDIVAAAVAEGVLNPLVAALSATNITWKAWMDILGPVKDRSKYVYVYPNNGWMDYCDNKFNPKNKSTINGTAKGVIGRLCQAYERCDKSGRGGNPASDAQKVLQESKMCCALMVTTGRIGTCGGGNAMGLEYGEPDYSRLVLCLRVSRQAQQLFEQPVFYAEVHYQGDPSVKESQQ